MSLNPNRKLVDTWKVNNFLKQTSTLMIDDQLSKTFSHCTTLELPKIKTTLLYENVNKATDHYIFKTCTLGSIDHYPTSWVHAYTDSAVSNGTKTASFCVHLRIPDG